MAKNVSDKLSKDMIANIKNYSKEVITLKDFVTSVRKNPGMYIGSTGNKGLINLIREILQNGLDELNKDRSPCDKVAISFDERTQTTIVEDNGRGIPFEDIERFFSKEHTSSNYEKKPYEYSSGLHGVGAKVTNALSGKFIVETYVLGEARRFEYDEGYPWKEGAKVIPNKENKQGTKIIFTPSKSAMGDTSITVAEAFNLVNLILPLCKIGAVVIFTGIDSKGKTFTEKLTNDDGIMTYIIDNVKSPLIKPVYLFRDNGTIRGEIAFTYDMNIGENGNIHDPAKLFAFCNTCPTTMGTHIDGFYEGICYYFTNYMNKIYLAKTDTAASRGKKKKPNKTVVKFDDVRYGLVSVISTAHLYPVFDGQSKEKLSNDDVKPFIKALVMDELDNWAKANPNDLNKICRYLKDIAEMRVKNDKERVNITKKYNASSLTGLPSNVVMPTGDWRKVPFEILFAEGESAAGAMRNDRINTMQGYMPLRGKILDAFNTPRAKFLANPEIAGMIAVILDGVKDYDINQVGKKPIPVDKIKWDKIIIFTDADNDGDHIAALMLRFFIVYMPELILAGKVYRLLPPLYGMKIPGKATGKYKRHNMKYFKDRIEYTEFLQRSFVKKYEITTYDGMKISPANLTKFLYNNIDYIFELEPVASNHSIPPSVLEDILILRNEPFDSFAKKIKRVYRFAEVTQNNGTIIIKGSIDGAIRTIFLNQTLIKECKAVIELLESNESYVYRMDGQPVGIYQIMKAFDNMNPSGVQRYKGLGEMNGPKLFDSTLNPENRTIIRYTMEDVMKTIERMKWVKDNMRVLLSEIKVSRFDVMD